MSLREDISRDLITVTCKRCGNVYKAHRMENALKYSHIPNYGCDACMGPYEDFKHKQMMETQKKVEKRCLRGVDFWRKGMIKGIIQKVFSPHNHNE